VTVNDVDGDYGNDDNDVVDDDDIMMIYPFVFY